MLQCRTPLKTTGAISKFTGLSSWLQPENRAFGASGLLDREQPPVFTRIKELHQQTSETRERLGVSSKAASRGPVGNAIGAAPVSREDVFDPLDGDVVTQDGTKER